MFFSSFAQNVIAFTVQLSGISYCIETVLCFYSYSHKSLSLKDLEEDTKDLIVTLSIQCYEDDLPHRRKDIYPYKI